MSAIYIIYVVARVKIAAAVLLINRAVSAAWVCAHCLNLYTRYIVTRTIVATRGEVRLCEGPNCVGGAALCCYSFELVMRE